MAEYKIPEYLYVIREIQIGQSDIYCTGYRIMDNKPWSYNEIGKDSGDYKVEVPRDIKTKEELIKFAKEKFSDAICYEIDGEYIS